MATLSENIEQTIHDFDSIKDSIEQKGVSVPLGTPTSGYAEKIDQIPTGIVPSGSVDITTNGEHDISEYATANVQVTQGIFPEGTIEITANGDYDVTSYVTASVNTPQPIGKIEITENGNDIDISQYATADVSVEKEVIDLIEGNYETYSIPEGTTKIANYAFYGSTIREIHIPESVEDIGQDAFNWSSLVSVSIPESIQVLQYRTFRGCSNLKDVIVSHNLKEIQDEAFGLCFSLTNLHDISNVELVGRNAFEASKFVIDYPDDVVYIGKALYKYKKAPYQMPVDTEIIVTPGTKSISDEAFSGQYNLKSISIPESVYSVGVEAFKDCRGLTSITLPPLRWSNRSMFEGCTSLQSVSISEGLTNIGQGMFLNCSQLQYIQLPDSLTSISDNAFYNCNNLVDLDIPKSVISIADSALVTTGWYENHPDGLVIAGSVIYKYKGDMPSGYILEIPNSFEIATINGAAFLYGTSRAQLANVIAECEILRLYTGCLSYCSNLSNLEFNNTVEIHGATIFEYSSISQISFNNLIDATYTHYGLNGMFGNCQLLESIQIVNTDIPYIGNQMFQNCSSLPEIVIPNTVIKILYQAFKGCTSLSVVYIPISLIEIEDDAFKDCSSLSDIYYEGTEEDWQSIEIGTGNEALESATFHFGYVYE